MSLCGHLPVDNNLICLVFYITGKGRKQRIVPLLPATATLVRRHLVETNRTRLLIVAKDNAGASTRFVDRLESVLSRGGRSIAALPFVAASRVSRGAIADLATRRKTPPSPMRRRGRLHRSQPIRR